MATHSNVYYVYNNKESILEAVEKATGCKNSHGLDLFRYKKNVYEGRSGAGFISESELPNLDKKIEAMGGIEKLNEIIAQMLKKTGLSPRYTRPDERKSDVFPPDPAKENIVFAKDVYGEKHYYSRFDYEGIEFFVLNKQINESFRQVFVKCEGFMLGIGQYQNIDGIKEWLESLENGLKSEVERRFNESIANPERWVDIGYANILGRLDEANAHNAPIREARELERQLEKKQREEKRIADEEAEKAEYKQAISDAENKILNNQTVSNSDIHGKSLIMQLFREHGISVPLKTQGWVINALHSIEFDGQRDKWGYRYFNSSKDSTIFSKYLSLLVSAIQTKRQDMT